MLIHKKKKQNCFVVKTLKKKTVEVNENTKVFTKHNNFWYKPLCCHPFTLWMLILNYWIR